MVDVVVVVNRFICMLLLLLWLMLLFNVDGKTVQGVLTKQGFPARSKEPQLDLSP